MTKHKLQIAVNVFILVAAAIASQQKSIDRFGLFVIVLVVLVVFNAVYAATSTEPDLPKSKRTLLGRWVVWPIAGLALLVFLIERFCG